MIVFKKEVRLGNIIWGDLEMDFTKQDEPNNAPNSLKYSKLRGDEMPIIRPADGSAEEVTKVNIADAELEALLSKQRAKIKVVGSGGAGNNTINRITEVGVRGAETIAVNTDAQDLLYTSADI